MIWHVSKVMNHLRHFRFCVPFYAVPSAVLIVAAEVQIFPFAAFAEVQTFHNVAVAAEPAFHIAVAAAELVSPSVAFRIAVVAAEYYFADHCHGSSCSRSAFFRDNCFHLSEE